MSNANPNEPGVGGQPPGDTIQIPKEPAANGGPPADPTTDPVIPKAADKAPRTFTVEDIEKARKEEKDKLYSRIDSMDTELKAMREEREKREAAERKAAEDAAAAQQARQAEEMSAKELLAQKEQEWNQRFSQIEAERQRSEAILEQERRLNELRSYRAERLDAEQENILPELRDLVTGNTEQEIEASLASLRERTERILGNVQAAQQQQRSGARGVPVTAPPVGPMDNQPEYETVTAEDIRNMDMTQYSKYRERLLGASSQARSNRGLFG